MVARESKPFWAELAENRASPWFFLILVDSVGITIP